MPTYAETLSRETTDRRTDCSNRLGAANDADGHEEIADHLVELLRIPGAGDVAVDHQHVAVQAAAHVRLTLAEELRPEELHMLAAFPLLEGGEIAVAAPVESLLVGLEHAVE